ncbi:MAG: hypothetical protein PHP64_06090 [Actinomycetota bacterium]|nr:hypothetical protein [Actinomycetota bacterium]
MIGYEIENKRQLVRRGFKMKTKSLSRPGMFVLIFLFSMIPLIALIDHSPAKSLTGGGASSNRSFPI